VNILYVYLSSDCYWKFHHHLKTLHFTFEQLKKILENIMLDAARIATGVTKLTSIQQILKETGPKTSEARRSKQTLTTS